MRLSYSIDNRDALHHWWKWAWVFVFLLVLAHSLIRCLLYRNLDIDEAEQFVLMQHLELGYSAQPPLYTWLVWGVSKVVGETVLTLALVKGLLILTLFFQMMQLGRWYFPDHRSIVVFATPLLLPLFAWEAWRMTHTPLLTVLCLATFLTWLRLRRTPSLINYVILGGCFGLGMLTKYNYALFAGSTGLACLLLPGWRNLVLSPRFLISLLVGGLIIIPHAWWTVAEWDDIVQYLRTRTGSSSLEMTVTVYLQRVSNYFSSLLIAGGIPVALLAVLNGKYPWKLDRADRSSVSFLALTIVIGLSTYLSFVVLGKMQHFRGHWLAPFLLLIPLWLLHRLPAFTVSQRPVLYYLGVAALISVIILGVRGSSCFRGYSDGSYQTRDYLFGALVDELSRQGVQPDELIAGDIHVAGYLCLYWCDIPVHVSSFVNPVPVLNRDRMTVVVWDATAEKGFTAETPAAFQTWCKENVPAQQIRYITTTPRFFHTRTTRLAYWVQTKQERR